MSSFFKDSLLCKGKKQITDRVNTCRDSQTKLFLKSPLISAVGIKIKDGERTEENCRKELDIGEKEDWKIHR